MTSLGKHIFLVGGERVAELRSGLGETCSKLQVKFSSPFTPAVLVSSRASLGGPFGQKKGPQGWFPATSLCWPRLTYTSRTGTYSYNWVDQLLVTTSSTWFATSLPGPPAELVLVAPVLGLCCVDLAYSWPPREKA